MKKRALTCWVTLIAASVAAGLLSGDAARASFIPGEDDDPFGTFTIDGGLDASAGMGLEIVIGDSGQSSCLAVIGEALLNGEIHITAASYINPRTDYQPGDSFIVFTATSIKSGSFANIPWDTPMYGDGVSLPRGPRWVLAKKWMADKKQWAAVLQVVK